MVPHAGVDVERQVQRGDRPVGVVRLDELLQFFGGVRIIPAPDGDTDQKGAGRLLSAP